MRAKQLSRVITGKKYLGGGQKKGPKEWFKKRKSTRSHTAVKELEEEEEEEKEKDKEEDAPPAKKAHSSKQKKRGKQNKEQVKHITSLITICS